MGNFARGKTLTLFICLISIAFSYGYSSTPETVDEYREARLNSARVIQPDFAGSAEFSEIPGSDIRPGSTDFAESYGSADSPGPAIVPDSPGSAEKTDSQETQGDSIDTAYDHEHGQFLHIPQSRTGVDNLLIISQQNLHSDPEKSAHAVFQALELAEVLRYHEGIVRSYNALGSVYHILGDSDYALEQFYSALENEIENPEDHTRVMNNIAMVHMDRSEYEKAAGFYVRALQKIQEEEIPGITVVTLSNLGKAYFALSEYEKSQHYHQKALDLASDFPDLTEVEAQVLADNGTIYKELRNFEEAEANFRKAMDKAIREGNTHLQSRIYLDLGRLYQALGRMDDAMEYSHRSLQLAENDQELTGIMESCKLLSELYEAQGNTAQSLLYYKEYFSAHESLLSSEHQNRITNRQIRFDLDHRNREIAILNEKTELQESLLANQELWRRFLLIILILTVIILGLLTRNIHLKKRAGIEQKKQGDEIEEKNRELILLNQEKDEFIGMAAHDLRNPLANISGVVHLMERTWDIKDEETREYIHILRDSIEKMVDLINNYLNINAIEQGKKNPEIKPVDIHKSLKQVADNFKKPAREKRVQLLTDLDQELLPVLADINYFHRIFENLVSNAIKFSPSGSIVRILANMTDSHMEISVSDNGPGITEEDQKKMFRRFCRLSNKPTGGETTTGLGLFIVKKLAEAMDGTVTYMSENGLGSRFTITLPLYKPSHAARQKVPAT